MYRKAARRPRRPASIQRALVVTGSVLALVIDIPFLYLWRDLTRAIVLRPDAFQMGRTVIPYEDMVSLGLKNHGQGDLVLTFEKENASGRTRRDTSLPRWVASHEGFRRELKRRAPGICLGEEGLRRRAVSLFANTVFLLWGTLAAALLGAYYVPPLRAALPWLDHRRLCVILVVGSVASLAYLIAAAGAGDDQSRRPAGD